VIQFFLNTRWVKNQPKVLAAMRLGAVRRLSATSLNNTSHNGSSRNEVPCARNVSSTPQKPTSTAVSLMQQPMFDHQMSAAASKIPVFYQAPMFFDRIAVTDSDGDFTYEDIFRRSCKLASELRRALGPSVGQNRVCVVCPKGVSFVVAQWAVWMSGHIVVPVLSDHSPQAIEYFVKNSNAQAVICTGQTADKLTKLDSCVEVLSLGDEYTSNPVQSFDPETDPIMVDVLDESFYSAMNSAMILYTTSASGKSVRKLMYRHANLNAQADSVSKAWQLSSKTSVLHGIPINTPYGISSAILAPLSVGGRVVMIPSNDPVKAWSLMLGLGYGIDKSKYPRTSVDVVCASPQQYQMMMDRYDELFTDSKKKQYVLNACKKRVRLMVSSMKPVPNEFLDPWRQATGHTILECYSTPEVRNLTF